MTTNRRNFLKQSGLGLATMLVSPYLFSCSENEASDSPFKNIGIQLYTLRDLLEQDAKGVLESVSKIGYKHIETFGLDTINKENFWGLTINDLKKILNDNGLKSYSGHYDLSKFLTKGTTDHENIEKYIEVAHELGQKYIVIPTPPMDRLNTLDVSDYQYFAEQLNKAGEMSKKAGIKMAYHNHFWEFKQFANGTKGLDIMIAFTEPDLVDFELDLFWIVKAGESPQAYFEKYNNRFPLWHIKDMDRNVSEPVELNRFNAQTGKRDTLDIEQILTDIRYTEVGTGSIDYTNIVRYASKSGLKYAFVEQDEIYVQDHLGSVRKSYDYIQRNIAK